MREEEKFVSELITKYIASLDPSQKISYSPGEDPPDSYLHYGKLDIPLEITSTEIEREPIFGKANILEITYERSHRKLLNDIERKAKKQNILKGTYVISFTKPLASENFAKIKSKFESLILNSLNKLCSEPVGFEETILHDHVSLAWVYKISENGAKLYDSYQDGALTESPEFLNYYRSVITKALNTKIEKLPTISNPIDCILAIINSYYLADHQAIHSACAMIPELKQFHTVIIINEKDVIVVHSINPEWSKDDA